MEQAVQSFPALSKLAALHHLLLLSSLVGVGRRGTSCTVFPSFKVNWQLCIIYNYCPVWLGWAGLEQAVQFCPVRYLAGDTWEYGTAGQLWPVLSRGGLIFWCQTHCKTAVTNHADKTISQKPQLNFQSRCIKSKNRLLTQCGQDNCDWVKNTCRPKFGFLTPWKRNLKIFSRSTLPNPNVTVVAGMIWSQQV